MFCLIFISIIFIAATAHGQQVEVRLRAPSITVYKKTLRVSDVAELIDGNPAIRQQLASLDLHEFNHQPQPVEITKRLIGYRAVIAGIDKSMFELTGLDSTQAVYAKPIDTSEMLQQTFVEQLSIQYQIPAESFELQFITDLEATIKRLELDPHTLLLTPQFPPELPLGQRSIQVQLTDHRQQSYQANVSVKISVYRDLVMAKENISRGEVLDEKKIERVRRPIDNPQVRFTSFDQAIGKMAQHDIQQFSLVQSQFVRDTSVSPGVPQYDVKRSQKLNIIIQRGSLFITLQDAQALENGQIGDYIDFLNPKSQARVRARIVDAQTATLEL